MAESLTFTANGSTTQANISVVYNGSQVRDFALDNSGGIDQRVGDDAIKVAIAKQLASLTFSSGVATGTVTVTAA